MQNKSIRVPITQEEHKAGKLEGPFEKWLKENEIYYFKQKSLDILRLPHLKKSITYKADFIFKVEDTVYIVETKGFHQNMQYYLLKKQLIQEYALKIGARFVEIKMHPKEYCLVEETEHKEAKRGLLVNKRTLMSEIYHVMKKVDKTGIIGDKEAEVLIRAKETTTWRLGKNGYIRNKAKLELFKLSYDYLYRHYTKKKNSKVDYLERFRNHFADYKKQED